MTEATSELILQFISGRYKGGEFPLFAGEEVIVGRSAEIDMVLVEDMVSRKHARITSKNGGFQIEDLGSTNGTFVNGERLKKQEPRGIGAGDRILVGTSILRVCRPGEKVEEASDAIAAAESRSEKAQAADRREERLSNATMSGRLEEIPIPDVLQMLGSSRKTGVLHLTSGPNRGRIYLNNGRIFYAVINDKHEVGPMKSVHRLVAWESGAFDLQPPEQDASFDIELDESIEGVLMEALRLKDEINNLGSQRPKEDQKLSLARPLKGLAKLSKDDLEMAEHVYNAQGTALDVLNASVLSDLDTYKALVRLIKAGVIQTG